MGKNLFAALWPNDSFGANANQPLNSKVELLRNYVALAHAFLAASASRMQVGKHMKVFVAPEYFFIKSYDPASHRIDAYTEDERKTIYSGLKSMSKQYSDMLIVPGSIFWKKSRKTPGGRNNDRHFDGLNTAAIFYKGSVKHEYTKKSDDGACGRSTDLVFRAGTKSQLFTIDKVKFGIEVCLDFNQQSLGSEASAESLDVEIYISGSNTHSFKPSDLAKIPVRKGGYFLHCDTSNEVQKVGVWTVKPGSGTHGVNRSDLGNAFDPWTLKPISIDSAGLGLSSSSMIQIGINSNYAKASVPSVTSPALQRRHSQANLAPSSPPTQRRGSLPPAPKPPSVPSMTNFNLVWGKLEPIAPMATPSAVADNGEFKVSVEASLMNNDAEMAGKALSFSSRGGRVLQPRATTDASGKAKVTVVCNRNTPATITCEFGGARIECSVALVSLGAGNVSKLGPLHGMLDPALKCWHLPL